MPHLCRGFCLAAAVVFMLFPGCGPKPKPTGQLHGKVTFEGAPVKDAKVQIQHETTGEAFAAIISSDGTYQFDTPVTAGDYRASVEPVFEAPAAGAGGPAAADAKPPERKDIPEKYRQNAQSGLKTQVKVGDNTYDIELKK